MFRKVVQDFTNVARFFQKGLPQQEPALPNAYKSNDRNVTGLSCKKSTTKVQQLETFSTQYTGVSKFLLGRIPAGRSSGIVKPSLGGDVQFKKLGDIARLNPALCYSEGQSVSFVASQQIVKNILAEGEKSDILSKIGGLMQNPISYSFREGEMVKGSTRDADKNQQLEALKSANKELHTKLQEFKNKSKELKEELDRKASEVNTLTEKKGRLEKELGSVKQGLAEKDKELESKNKELENKIQDLQTRLKSKDEELKSKIQQLKALEDENKELKTKLQESESKNKELEDNKDRKPPAVNVQGVKGKVNYASASFILSGVCAAGASLATPYLAICATLAVAASVFLALGCYCLYKANTTLSNVEVDQQDNQRLLESSL
ncbi:MAG: hypothetical protein LBU56_03130 [Rickettsiales bacterium]|jgi:hypothetical protein|nr:hypothetical protein [Rickettsiales bacterium]